MPLFLQGARQAGCSTSIGSWRRPVGRDTHRPRGAGPRRHRVQDELQGLPAGVTELAVNARQDRGARPGHQVHDLLRRSALSPRLAAPLQHEPDLLDAPVPHRPRGFAPVQRAERTRLRPFWGGNSNEMAGRPDSRLAAWMLRMDSIGPFGCRIGSRTLERKRVFALPISVRSMNATAVPAVCIASPVHSRNAIATELKASLPWESTRFFPTGNIRTSPWAPSHSKWDLN